MASKQRYKHGQKNLWILLLLLPLLLLVLVLFLIRRKTIPMWEQLIQQSQYKSIADFIVAQARHESANLSSHLAIHAHNIFGFKTYRHTPFEVPESEKKSGDPNYYMTFEDLEECAQYMIDWLQRHGIQPKPMTLDKYVERLYAAKFFTDSPTNYRNGLSRYL